MPEGIKNSVALKNSSKSSRNPDHHYVSRNDSMDHETDFHKWNKEIQKQYLSQYKDNRDGRLNKLVDYPLYRSSRQHPDDVFRSNGQLLTSTELTTSLSGRKTFSLIRQQEDNAPSVYSSMTTSLPAATEFSDLFGRSHIYVTDPQPHGRYLNGVRYDNSREVRSRLHQVASTAKDRIGSKFSKDYAYQRAQDFPVAGGYLSQQQISVPGNIPSRSIRGVIPYDPEKKQLDWSRARVNEHYVPPHRYRDFEAENS